MDNPKIRWEDREKTENPVNTLQPLFSASLVKTGLQSLIYILADNKPVASIEIIREPITVPKSKQAKVDIISYIKEQPVTTVNVNCNQKQVLASYKKHFSKFAPRSKNTLSLRSTMSKLNCLPNEETEKKEVE